MSKTIDAGEKHWAARYEKKSMESYILGIVLDATLSFTSVYPQIYYFLERLLIGLKQIQEENPRITLNYALTLLKDAPEQVLFSKGTVTDDENELLEALSEVEFSGGSSDGEENLTGAIHFLLDQMEDQGTSHSQKGLLLLSDAIAGGERGFADLTRSTGLRFAYVYSGKDDYMPQFRMVDGRGNLTENEQNICTYASLSELLTETEEEEVRLAEELAREMVTCFA